MLSKAAGAMIAFSGSIASMLFGFVAVGIFLLLSGRNPLAIYTGIFTGAFGDTFCLSETLVAATPIMFCALAVAIAARLGLMNIGVEGQLLFGAIGSTYVALTMPETTPSWLMLLLMAISACVCGALLALMPALMRVFMDINETIVSLLLNYVAALTVEYLIHGPWQDPTTTSWPQTMAFPPCAEMPHLEGSRVHLGLLVALVIGFLLMFVLHSTKFGFKAKVIGSNAQAALYAKYPLKRYLIVAMLLSGAVAALAGFSQVSAIEGRLRSGLSPGYGYTGFLVCFLAKHNPLTIIVVSILLGGFLSGADSLQLSEKLPFATVNILQGMIFIFLLASENALKSWSEKLRFKLQPAEAS